MEIRIRDLWTVVHGIGFGALKGFGGAGVLDVVEEDIGGTDRAVYTVKFAEAGFVLHCFQKKSERGIPTPRETWTSSTQG